MSPYIGHYIFWKTVKGFKGMGFKDNRILFLRYIFLQAEGVAKQGLWRPKLVQCPPHRQAQHTLPTPTKFCECQHGSPQTPQVSQTIVIPSSLSATLSHKRCEAQTGSTNDLTLGLAVCVSTCSKLMINRLMMLLAQQPNHLTTTIKKHGVHPHLLCVSPHRLVERLAPHWSGSCSWVCCHTKRVASVYSKPLSPKWVSCVTRHLSPKWASCVQLIMGFVSKVSKCLHLHNIWAGCLRNLLIHCWQ